EMGKRISMDLLRDFLKKHAHEMPRTMLRYAIEQMSEEERLIWMNAAAFSDFTAFSDFPPRPKR
ncbi:MAG: DNA alkylation repair protein, partial [Bacteroidales bacterium]|nr:DNA alkylation repair protein [Bacteroidales bacterium]